jgi:hypothetical protein
MVELHQQRETETLSIYYKAAGSTAANWCLTLPLTGSHIGDRRNCMCLRVFSWAVLCGLMHWSRKVGACILFTFICSLFNDIASNSVYLVSNDWKTVNNERERILKEAVVTRFKAFSWRDWGNPRKSCQDSRCPDWDSNWAPQTSEELLLEITCSDWKVEVRRLACHYKIIIIYLSDSCLCRL